MASDETKDSRTPEQDITDEDIQATGAPTRSVKRIMADTQSKSILNITNLVTLSILIGLIMFVVKIASVFGIFIFSFVIAFLMFPMVEWFTEKRVPRVWAILIVYIIFGSALFGIVAAIVPTVISQANALINQLPDFSEKWEEDWAPWLAAMQDRLYTQGYTVDDIEQYLRNFFPTLQQWSVKAGHWIASGLQGAVGGIVFVITVPIIVFYLLLDAPRIRESLMKFAPRRTTSEIQNLLNRLADMLNHYLRGQLKLSFLMFVITSIALWIMGVRHWLLLGVLAGITEIIPIIGPIIALVPALLVSYFSPSTQGLLVNVQIGWVRAFIVFAFYMILQYVEGNILVPRIMGKDLNLHPLTVMFSLLAGGFLAGFLGMLLSLPIAASLKVVFETYYPSFIQRVEDLVSRRPSPSTESRE